MRGAIVGGCAIAGGSVITQSLDCGRESTAQENELSIEARLFLEGLRLKYGYDFRNYAESSMIRRVKAVLRRLNVSDPISLLRIVLDDPSVLRSVLTELTVTTSEIFRDPEFFKALRENVVPVLRTFPNINIWVAGSSTGEEVISLCILLQEEDLLSRSVLFATDINPGALQKAQDGIYDIETIKKGTKNYQLSGGKEAFGRYYTADYGLVKMDSDLTRNVVFTEHNLVTDHVFTECHLVLCRNVLIYFNAQLQDRVFNLFSDSLRYGGFLGLGSKESLRFSTVSDRFNVVNKDWKIYRKTHLGSGLRGASQ